MSNNLFKHYIALLLAVVMVLALLPIHAVADVVGQLNDSSISLSDSGSGTWQASGDTISGSVSGKGGTCSSAGDATLYIKNISGVTKKLKFNYVPTLNGGTINIDGTGVTSNGTYNTELSNNGTCTINMKTQKGAYTTSISITDLALVLERDVTVEFIAPSNGTYTVNSNAITQNTEITQLSTMPFVLSATPANGYKFVAWINEENGSILSMSANYNLSTDISMTVSALFAPTSAPVFSVSGKPFTDLNSAVDYAEANNEELIVLVANGTLPSGNYTIPYGKSLLIPMDAASTTVKDGIIATNSQSTNPSVYKQLTMANGAVLTVNGSLQVAAKVYSPGGSSTFGNRPVGGFGLITMNAGSSIVVNNNASLYCYGFIQGTGTILANNGATIHEVFSVLEHRGGTNLSSWISGKHTFPMSQYYVQNIEVPTTFLYGSKDILHTSLYASGQYDVDTMQFIGYGSAGLFRLKAEGGKVIKQYDATKDRLIVDIHGDSEVASITLSMAGQTVDSSNYVLPINSNISINVVSGTTTIKEDVELLPEVRVNIAQGANAIIESGKTLFVYDKTDWLKATNGFEKGFVFNNKDFVQANYRPGGIKTRTISNNASIDVNGTLSVNGYLNTTKTGADIISSQGTGRVVFNIKSSARALYQVTDGSNEVTITTNGAWLKNGDGSYVMSGDSAAAGDTYAYSGTGTEGRWIKNPVYITFEANGGEGTMPVQTVEKNVETALNLNTFTREGYVFTGWNTVADGTGTAYADGANITANSDITLYAQWEVSEHTLTINYVVPEGFTAPAQYSGTFTEGEEYSVTSPNVEGCTPDTAVVTGTMGNEDVTVTVTYSVNKYTVTWKNEDGTVLETDENVSYNSTPSYDGATPVKDSDDTNHYTFTGWDPEIVPVTGPATYTAVFTAEPHTYGTPSWTWTGYTAATATFTCSECGHTHPVTATITSVTTDPTCTSDGETVYTATVTFNGQNYTDTKTEVLSATGHTWGTPTYVWADDNSTVTATCVCANDPAHVETETVNTSYVVTTPATCENDGVGTYTATFSNSAFATQTKEVEIPATGHNWDLDNPVWGVPTGIIFPTVTITFTCTVCGETTQITAETVGFVTEQDASCVEGGYKEATFEASFGGRTFEKTIRWDEEPADPTLHPFDLEEHGAVAATCTEEGNSAYWYCPVCEKYFSDAEGLNEIEENSWIIPATGHTWGTPSWTWTGYTAATATFTCSVCGYSQTVTAEITSDTTPATPTQPGSIVYTATVEFNGNTYTNVETETLTYTGWKIDENGKTYIIDGEIAYHNQWQTIEDATYWFDDAGYVLDCGIYWLPYPEGYGPDQWNIDNSNQPYTNAGYLTNSFFSIDANGKLEKDANGFRTLPEGTVVHCKEDDETLTESFEIWLVNGEMPWHPGLVTDGTDYYYFPTGYFDAKRAKISGTNYYISKTNELEWPDIWGEGVFSTGLYTFDNEGKLQLLDGLIDKEDKTYYYDHGMLTYAGVIKIGDYFYYVKSDYTIVKDATYYVIAEKTNGLTGAGLHDFDNYGHMFLPNGDPHFTGIIKVDDDNWFYYEDGVKSYAGLIEIDGHLYYVNSQFKVIHNADYPICKTNGLKPQGTYYFDENGWLEEINETLNGIVKEGDKWYYYVDGIKTYAGVFKIGNDFYYAKSDGEVIHGRSYYISKTNGLVEKGQYDFDEEGRMFMYNGIYKNDNGIWIYYVNGVKTYAGVILIDGYYYYVKSDFQVVHDRSYVVNKTNNLVSPGTYQFDAEGHMIIN